MSAIGVGGPTMPITAGAGGAPTTPTGGDGRGRITPIMDGGGPITPITDGVRGSSRTAGDRRRGDLLQLAQAPAVAGAFCASRGVNLTRPIAVDHAVTPIVSIVQQKDLMIPIDCFIGVRPVRVTKIQIMIVNTYSSLTLMALGPISWSQAR